MYILAFNGSPRRKGNTSHLLNQISQGAHDSGAHYEEFIADELNVKNCRGCLRCNLLRRCSLKGDDWPVLSEKILAADMLIFASPVYFHHFTAPIKKLIDRFRSFVHVHMLKNGLGYEPWHIWQKKFILLLCMGSSQRRDAKPAIDLMKFITSILGDRNSLEIILGVRMVVSHQVIMNEKQLVNLYAKLGLPAQMAKRDYHKNQALLKKCYHLGRQLTSSP